jgi:hypothetical protein
VAHRRSSPLPWRRWRQHQRRRVRGHDARGAWRVGHSGPDGCAAGMCLPAMTWPPLWEILFHAVAVACYGDTVDTATTESPVVSSVAVCRLQLLPTVRRAASMSPRDTPSAPASTAARGVTTVHQTAATTDSRGIHASTATCTNGWTSHRREGQRGSRHLQRRRATVRTSGARVPSSGPQSDKEKPR